MRATTSNACTPPVLDVRVWVVGGHERRETVDNIILRMFSSNWGQKETGKKYPLTRTLWSVDSARPLD